MINDTTELTKKARNFMEKKSWIDIPYENVLAILYILVGLGQAGRPVQRITQLIESSYGYSAEAFGLALGTGLMAFGVIVWAWKPREKFLMLCSFPIIVWMTYTITTIVSNPTSSLSTAAMIGIAIYLVIRQVELQKSVDENDAYMHQLLHDLIERQESEPKTEDRIPHE